MNITIYSTPQCSFCSRAKRLLNSHSIPYSEVNIALDRDAKNYVLQYQKTVPLIVLDGNPIGGYTELVEYMDQMEE